MKLPYGLADFYKIRRGNYLYVDKTSYIEKIECLNADYLFLIRPRRFGKSLFLSTLAHYYDLEMTVEFPNLFGDLYIGKNPTPSRNSYLILKLNFSGLNTGNRLELEKSFQLRLIDSIMGFLNKYQRFFTDTSLLEERMKTPSDISSIFNSFIEEVKKTGEKIYLIIDEYDHFANDIISMGDGLFYKEIVRAAGFVRDFYETIKIGTESVIDRIFITGISPIMLNDLTSGFNIAANITMDESMNEMLGFTEQELMDIINRLGIKQEDIQIKLGEHYNGYLFNDNCNTRVYNPEMVLYYFDIFLRTKKPPRQLIADNVKTDYSRLNRLTINQENRQIIEEIIKEEEITANIVTQFPFDRMYDREYFISLLFYLGLLTIKGTKYHTTLLGIPNYVVRTIFWEYFDRKLKEEYAINFPTEALAKTIWEMAFEGNLKPFIDFIGSNVLKPLSNRDTINFNEKYIKVILFSYLITTNLYKPVSEREVENGYLDIYLEKDLRMPEVKYEWLLELKYLKHCDRDQLPAVKEKGSAQLKKYASSPGFRGKKDLKQALLIFIGKDEYLIFEF
jgi:hypothetical protein